MTNYGPIRPVESLHNYPDNTAVLVRLDTNCAKSRHQVATLKNGKPFVIGGLFYFDCPTVLGWWPLPEEDEK